MRLLKEQEAIWRRLNDPAGLSGSLGNQRDPGLGTSTGALLKEQDAICRRLNDPAGLSGSLTADPAGHRGLDGAMRRQEEAICVDNDPPAVWQYWATRR